jgi:hypothetical protein
MKQDIPLCPMNTGFLGVVRIMFQANGISKLVEKLLGFGEDGSGIKTA